MRSECTFPARGPEGEAIVLRVLTPLPWNRIDARDLPDPVPAPSVARAMERLTSTAAPAGVIAVLGLQHTVARAGTADVRLLATLTVALKDLPGPMPESRPDHGVAPIELSTAGGRYGGVRVRRVAWSEVLPGRPPVAFLTVQYMVRTRYGVLASTFATPQQENFDCLILELDKIASGIWVQADEQG